MGNRNKTLSQISTINSDAVNLYVSARARPGVCDHSFKFNSHRGQSEPFVPIQFKTSMVEQSYLSEVSQWLNLGQALSKWCIHVIHLRHLALC